MGKSLNGPDDIGRMFSSMKQGISAPLIMCVLLNVVLMLKLDEIKFFPCELLKKLETVKI